MIYMLVKSSEKTRSLIRNFERFLETYNLKMLKYWDGKSTYEIAVNTSDPTAMKWVNHLAIDFFNGDLISLRTELKEPAGAQENWQQDLNRSLSPNGDSFAD